MTSDCNEKAINLDLSILKRNAIAVKSKTQIKEKEYTNRKISTSEYSTTTTGNSVNGSQIGLCVIELFPK
jgi:hypothetical protein